MYYKKEDKVKWLEINEKKILLCDCSKLGGDDIIKVLNDALSFYEGLEENSVLNLSDYTETYADEKSLNAIKSVTSKVDKYIRKGAVVEITGTKKIFLSVINKMMGKINFKQFTAREEAIKCLIED